MNNIEQILNTSPDTKTVITMNYLRDLARETGVNGVETWDIDALFTDENKKLIHDSRELNKRFFKALKDQDIMKEVKVELTSVMANKVKGLNEKLKLQMTAQIDKQISDKHRQLRDYCDAFDRMQKEIFELDAKKKGYEFGVENDILEILKMGFFKLFDISEDGYGKSTVVFYTDPVVLQATRNDGMYYRVEMGSYYVYLKVQDRQIQVVERENNPIYSQHFHPYISQHGGICWGTAQETASRMISDGRFLDVFRLLHSLLTSYSYDTRPYYPLEKFASHGQLRNGSWAKKIVIDTTKATTEEIEAAKKLSPPSSEQTVEESVSDGQEENYAEHEDEDTSDDEEM